MAKTGVMNFAPMVNKLLAEYGDEVNQTVRELIPEGCERAVQTLRTDSKKRTGLYAKDWTHKVSKTSRWGWTYIVYNRKHYRVAHLLENSHPFKNASGKVIGNWKGDGVIAATEDKVAEWMENEMFRRLGG